MRNLTLLVMQLRPLFTKFVTDSVAPQVIAVNMPPLNVHSNVQYAMEACLEKITCSVDTFTFFVYIIVSGSEKRV